MPGPVEVLLLHEDQLADVASLLSELDIEWLETGAAGHGCEATALVIGTPQHLLRWKAPGDPRAVARIALCDGGGRLLEKRLRAEGIDYVLRRPVHPTALRLLVQHVIYKGPERRRRRRVDAAVAVRVRAGWKSHDALLLEFSSGGCSLLTRQPLAVERALKITMPPEIGGDGPLVVKGAVVRCHEAPEGSPGEHVVGVRFDEAEPDTRQRLARAVVARARRERVAEVRAAARPTGGGARAARADSRPEPAPVPPAEPAAAGAPGAAAPAECPAPDEGERRRAPRAAYPRKVHGRIGHEPVVLVGSNLSAKGMRVKPESRLRPGLALKLELYGRGDVPPIALDARVARDDGEHGLYLEFVDLWPGAPALIERLMKTLPLLQPRSGGGMVISEVIEHR